MNISEVGAADPDTLAPAALAALQRLAQSSRDGAIPMARLVTDDDADFNKAASWIADITAGAISH